MPNNTQPLGLFQTSLLNTNNDYISALAKEFAQKDAYYRQVLGDVIVDNGMATYGPQFFTLIEQQLSQNPNITASLQGNSGQLQNQLGVGPVNTPAMVNARLGIENNSLRGGVNMAVVRMPNGSYMQIPRTYDVGYNSNALGGNVDIGATYTPKTEQMPKAMYGVQARYTKQF